MIIIATELHVKTFWKFIPFIQGALEPPLLTSNPTPSLLRVLFEVLEQLRPKLEGIPKPSRTCYKETSKRTEKSSKPIDGISKKIEKFIRNVQPDF